MAPKDAKPFLEHTLSRALTTRAANSRLRTLTLPAPHSADFSSNDFLSLSHSPHLRALFLRELSAQPLGSGGSRLLDGNSPYAEELERAIARHHRAPPDSGLLFTSGFDANASLFACVPQSTDTIVYDAHIHASVHEGMRASRVAAARRTPFAHNCLASFREVLCAANEESSGGNVFVAVESLYSMDGDLAPLREMVDIADEVLVRGALFVVDEAHATGVIGEGGRGLVCLLGLEERVFARLHTFGKALACNGAILLTTPLTRQYLLNYARPLIYTTSLSFPALAAISSAYTLLRTPPHAATLQAQLRALITRLHALLAALPPAPALLTLPGPPPQPTPIVALLTPHPRSLAAHLQRCGFVARPIVFPTVPRGGERVRLCVHAGNTVAEVEGLVDAVRGWLVEWGRGSRL